MKSLEVVVGGQFGSEAKGHVTQRLAEKAVADGKSLHVVRVAGPNAGHTGYDLHGERWALRQVPVAAVIPGPAILGIAAGSEIDPAVLFDEYDRLKDAGLMRNKMLWVHGEATVIRSSDKDDEAFASHHDLVAKIGSTGKGIGAARAGRLMREPGRRVFDDEHVINGLADRGIPIADPSHVIHTNMSVNSHLIIEGTQGFGLGLHAGFYPQCTSSDCRAIDFLAMAGVSPWQFHDFKVWVVARIYPIRVAGNSGPLKDETTWEELNLPAEYTTVTKKVRRVGAPDWDLVARAVAANGGGRYARLAVTMLDQMFPKAKDLDVGDIDQITWTEMHQYLANVERTTGAAVEMVTNGPNSGFILNDPF